MREEEKSTRLIKAAWPKVTVRTRLRFRSAAESQTFFPSFFNGVTIIAHLMEARSHAS